MRQKSVRAEERTSRCAQVAVQCKGMGKKRRDDANRRDESTPAAGVPSRAELERIVHLISAAREDYAAWSELRQMRREFREREIAHEQRARHDRTGEWPAIGTPSFLARVRQMRSLHVPQLLRGRTRLMTHQLMNRVFMGPGTGYNGVLLAHDTGTGKSRTAIAIAEQYAHIMRNRACVIGPGNVRAQFRSEIASAAGARFRSGRWELADKWRGSVYATAASRVRDPDRSALVERLDATIAARYEFHGWTAFANEWSRLSASRRADNYSDRVFVVDEAHNLRPQKGGKETKRAMRALRCIAQTCFNVKFVLLTATPMFDRAEEIVELVNLLRLNDDRPPVPPSSAFPESSEVDDDAVRELVRGYVSVYTRVLRDPRVPISLDVRQARVPGVRDEWPALAGSGEPSDGEAAVMCHVAASRLQSEHPALQASSGAGKDGGDSGESGAVPESAEATNAVFPGGLIGRRGFAELLDPGTGRYKTGHEGAFGPDRLAEISPKVASIVEKAVDAEGIVMVYTNFVWAGVKLLAAALEERGFMPCRFETGVTAAGRARRAGPTYATLSDGADVKRVLELVKSPANISGKVIKVLLCTKVVAEGVDLACVREVHILEGWWNLSREDQVIGRAVRFGSHDALPDDKRNVTIYRYGLMRSGDREGFDHDMARIAVQKRNRITHVMDLMREESFDCLAYKREAIERLADAKTVKQASQVTSQGVRVDAKAFADPVDETKARIDGLCGRGANDTLEVGDPARDGGWDVDDYTFRDVLEAVRDSLGDGVSAGKVYKLDDLVRIAGVPDDLAVRAITELLRSGTALTPSAERSDTAQSEPRTLISLAEDEYALSETLSGKHGIVVMPLTIWGSAAGKDRADEWTEISRTLKSELDVVLAGSDVDDDIVVDMVLDRALGSRGGHGSDDVKRACGEAGIASIRRARGLGDAEKLAGLDTARGGLVFVAKRGAACAHMTRAAITRVLQSRGVPPPPAHSNRTGMCLYAEYHLRRLDLVAREEAAKLVDDDSETHENDPENGQKSAGVNHTVRTAQKPEKLTRRSAGRVVNESSQEPRDTGEKGTRKRSQLVGVT